MCHLILPLMWWKMPVDLSFSTGLNATFSLYSLSVNCLLNGSLFHSFDVLYPISYSYYSPVACFLSHANNVHFSLRQLFLSVEFWVDVDFFSISLINMFRPFFFTEYFCTSVMWQAPNCSACCLFCLSMGVFQNLLMAKWFLLCQRWKMRSRFK